MRYDVIIAGAGPAGAAAAIALARANRSVLVLERSKHHRHKPCGGGLSARLLPFLDPDVKETLEEAIFKVSFFLKEKWVTIPSAAPIAYLVRRSRFDAYLVEKARASGAEVREESPLLDWSETSGGIEVESGSGADCASFLIGADGVYSQVARRLHPLWKKRLAYSVEAEAAPRGEKGEVLIDLSAPAGYGWIFPKENDAAIGIAGFRGRRKDPRKIYREFLERRRLFTPGPPSGYSIPLYFRSSFPLARGRGFLAGDAAALVDPLFGEGIFYAVRSGQIAAKILAAATEEAAGGQGAAESYDREIRAAFTADFEVAERMARWIYTFPGLFLEGIRRHPKAMLLYYEVLRGERSYREYSRAVQREFFRRWNPFSYIFAASNRS